MLRKQFVTKTETYGDAYQILNKNNKRSPRTNDSVIKMLITIRSRGQDSD
jgi:hypothetical protein